jgi:hypothetical protein
MIPTQERPGQYWMSGDRAELWFSESGPEAPKTITCLTPHGGQAITKVDELELLGAGLFGEGRPCLGGSAKWTGDCYRYGVYLGHKAYSGPSIVETKNNIPNWTSLFRTGHDNPEQAIRHWQGLVLNIPLWSSTALPRHKWYMKARFSLVSAVTKSQPTIPTESYSAACARSHQPRKNQDGIGPPSALTA